MGFIGGFTDRFIIAVGVWPFASFVLTLPILAFLYNRDGKLSFWSIVGAYFSVLYSLGLVFFTLWPLPSGDSGLGITYGVPPQLNPVGFINDIQKDGVQAVFQIIANIVFFVPLGFIFKRGFRMSLFPAIILSFAFSLLIETAQLTGLFGIYEYSYRTFDVDDLAWNTLGAVAGWYLGKVSLTLIPVRKAETKVVDTHPGLVHRCVAFLLDMSLVGIASLVILLGLSLVMYLLGFDSNDSSTVVSLIAMVATLVVFVIVEAVFPWMHNGQTPGGMFVRMSIEGHPREQPYRIAFYSARILCILALFILTPIALPVILIYYLICRQMPYDAIP